MLPSTCGLVVRRTISTNVHSTHISIPLGIFIGLLASFVQSLGLTIQRKSHVLNQLLPEHQRRVEHRRPLWLFGFAIFISSNVFGSLVQIAALPVVILAPLGAVSLLWNAFFARLILGDVFSPWMILGTILIASGAVLIAFFGIVPEPTRSLEDLLTLFSRPAFVAYFSILGAVVICCLAATHITEYAFTRKLSQIKSSPSETYSTHAMTAPYKPPAALTTGLATPAVDAGVSTERTPLLDHKSIPSSPTPSLYGHTDDSSDPKVRSINGTRLLLAVSYASFSGIISGMCLLFAKSGVELLLLTLRGQNQFWRWQAWVLVAGLVIFALLQLWYLHKALVLADPTLVCPSAFCFYNISSIINGLVYFDQFSLIPPSHLGLIVLGMFVLLGGVWVVSIQPGSKPVDIEAWTENDGLPDIEETSVFEDASRDVGETRIAPFHARHGDIGPVTMERETRSESNIHDLARSSSSDDPSFDPELIPLFIATLAYNSPENPSSTPKYARRWQPCFFKRKLQHPALATTIAPEYSELWIPDWAVARQSRVRDRTTGAGEQAERLGTS
ncbi:putative magnesium transporter NIPA [Lyophyllum shimeji]|uniref:Magnesium transporter NIPA n=1 Tax=Lyophyllum shimeji TaxID=47721 RepID=A0A9P3PIP2_LYOSH|nr:putative magnesium transporter NIPA [Lyophyllum shimeji]